MFLIKKATKKLCTAFKLLHKHGLKEFISIVFSMFILNRSFVQNYIKYLCMKKNMPSKKQVEKEYACEFNYSPQISVIVPLFNTKEEYLKEMIDSVLNQTYSNFELCLFDTSDEKHKYVGEICTEYKNKCKKIKYTKGKENLGIAENTNETIKLSTGKYIALLDHDDILHPSALFDVVSAINEQDADFIYTDESTFEKDKLKPVSVHFKPDYSPDTLRSYNYICHFSVFSRKLLDKVGLFSKEYDGSQDYDMILRLSEKAENIVHIARVLYFWRISETSVANDNFDIKPYCIDSAKKAIAAHLKRIGLEAEVHDSTVKSTYRISYKIHGEPLVSIIIPNKDHVEDLDKCLSSIVEKSSYNNYEILVVENNSEEKETFEYYNKIGKNKKIRVIYYEGEFNYSKINNFAVEKAKGEYYLFLNNDTEVITERWIEEMLMFVQREDVGAAGAKLYFPDDTIQHAGVIMGINNVAGHSHKMKPRDDHGYQARPTIAQNLSGVTAACMLVKKSVFKEINGFNEDFAVNFNDVDLCLRIRKAGYLIVFTPYSELYHYESKSRGFENESKAKMKRFYRESDLLNSRWEYELKHDPYYNKNLTLKREDFCIAVNY